MAIRQKVDDSSFGAFCTFWVLSCFLIVLCLVKKTAFLYHHARVFTMIACGIHAGLSLEAFDAFRKHGGTERPQLRQFAVAQALLGIAGLFLFLWQVGTALLAPSCWGKNRKDEDLSWKTAKRSRLFFYCFVIDLTFTGFLIAGLALSLQHVPSGYAGCRKARLGGTMVARIGWLSGVTPKTMCHRLVTVQITGVMLVIQPFLQAAVVIPVMAWPRAVRYALFMLCRGPRQADPWDREIMEKDDVECQVLLPHRRAAALAGPEAAMRTALADDRIAGRIAGYLHTVDVDNMAYASRSLWKIINEKQPASGSSRKDLFCEKACGGRMKTECWACTRLLCAGCSTCIQGNLPVPRTETHAQNCFAVCTKCYLLRAPAMAAPWAAVRNPSDLSVQHTEHCRHCVGKTVNDPVLVCRKCAQLKPKAISRVRELRELGAMRKMEALGGRLWCAGCQRSLRKGRRRWFICEEGEHECHWEGHDQD